GAGGGPEEPTVRFGDQDVVDARLTAAHQTALVELPQLVAVAALPVAGIVVPFVLEPHHDAIVGERPQGFDQPVVELALPLAGKEGADLVAAGNELRAVLSEPLNGSWCDFSLGSPFVHRSATRQQRTGTGFAHRPAGYVRRPRPAPNTTCTEIDFVGR